jgi:hypothetical protein
MNTHRQLPARLAFMQLSFMRLSVCALHPTRGAQP